MSHPSFTSELVRFLDEAFPNQCPSPAMSEREIWMAAGAARVVTGLKAVLAERQSTASPTVEKDSPHVLRQFTGSEEPGSASSSPDGAPSGPGNRC